jgi:CO/xanthine dehydrogenase FAD-binding subunit
MKAARFDYLRPGDVGEALAALAKAEGGGKLLAGGQSLGPMLNLRLARPSLLVDVSRLDSLARVDDIGSAFRIGAGVTHSRIEDMRGRLAGGEMLCEVAAGIAYRAIRNRGTVGGSLAHADPAAEMPGIAITCEAKIVVAGPRGQRAIPATGLFVGALSTSLDSDELIVEVRLPPWRDNRRWGFQEFSRRRGDFALAGVALFYDNSKDGQAANVHVGAIGVGDTPLRLSAVEAAIEGKVVTETIIRDAGAAASESVHPADDIHASGDYRRALVGVLTERALARAAGLPWRGDI